jgi:hypothetical protein
MNRIFGIIPQGLKIKIKRSLTYLRSWGLYYLVLLNQCMKIKTPCGNPHQTKLDILIPNTTINSQADIPSKLLGSIPCDRK